MTSATFMLIFYFLWQNTMPRPSKLVNLQDGSPVQGHEVKAKTGKLVTEFLGIPFAEPPIGKLRFRKPRPNKSWRTVLNATVPPNACMQSSDTYFGDFQGATMWNANVPISEDCLYLNVIVPGEVYPDAKLTVMVWVYGGGFWSGCSTLDVYDGKILASEENVIIVSMNYRVSVFGFLYLGREEAPGNAGLWDQLLAFKWVARNIAQFGGDPDHVTLFGESAGAASLSVHLISQHSRPYFERAILQSGSATAPWALVERDVAITRAVGLCESLQCGNISLHDQSSWDLDILLQCVLDAPAEKLRLKEWPSKLEFAEFPWVPLVDGDLLIEQARVSFGRGNFKTGQLLVGSNLDEAIYFIVYTLQETFVRNEIFIRTDFVTNRKQWWKSSQKLLPKKVRKSGLALAAVKHEYEPYSLPIDPIDWTDSLDKMLGDLQFTCNVNEFALSHSLYGGNTYYYQFAHRASQQTWPAWMGVLHGYEINFIFGEPLNRVDFGYSDQEQQLSRQFMRYWANFARTGNPNRNPDGTYTSELWPLYTSSSMKYMNLTVESDYTDRGASRTGHGPRRKQCAFWKQLLPDIISAVDDYPDGYIRWKKQFDRWNDEYIADWSHHFEQYKKYQNYRRMDASDQCDLIIYNGHTICEQDDSNKIWNQLARRWQKIWNK